MMPPSSTLTPADVQPFTSWVQAGAQATGCATP